MYKSKSIHHIIFAIAYWIEKIYDDVLNFRLVMNICHTSYFVMILTESLIDKHEIDMSICQCGMQRLKLARHLNITCLIFNYIQLRFHRKLYWETCTTLIIINKKKNIFHKIKKSILFASKTQKNKRTQSFVIVFIHAM